ncbi:MAG: prolipoprotein diacylglyceryl transferase, partial [Oscillospiraceae bacterium]|nr:prolipoprotein diacylglyceryl transferase [Oscillospiraceae bacterium]
MSDTAITFPILGDGFVLNPQRYLEIFGFKIYWYGLIIALGFIVAALYLLKRRKVFGLEEDDIYTMIIFAVPLGIIGARLYYIVFNFDSFRADTFGEFIKNCLNVRNGGLAIYGGVIFGIIGLILSAKVRKVKIGTALDVGAFGVIIGQIFGRWGNFINREAYGISANVDSFFLRMGLTTPDGVTTYVHPTFLYE